MSETLDQTIRIMHTMDAAGHTSLGWDAADDEWILPLIRRKMVEGYVFWIVRRNPLREVRMERVEDIGDTRHVIIRDAESRELFEQGRIGLVSVDAEDDLEVTRRARTAEEVVANDTVQHRPLRGG
jgi:hypothetical protein